MVKPTNRRCYFLIADWLGGWQSPLSFRSLDLKRLDAEPGTVASQSQLDPVPFLHARLKVDFFFFFFFHLGSKMLSHWPDQKSSFCYKTVQEAYSLTPAQKAR